MAYLGRARKEDLRILCEELSITTNPDNKLVELKALILNSEDYDEPFVREILERVINDRLRKEEQKHEIEKVKAQILSEVNANISSSSENGANDHTNSIDLFKLIHRFESKDNDISLYLTLFERQCKRVKIKYTDYVTYLLGLLPVEMSQVIARESDEKCNDYEHIKGLLLKRFKLSPEKFRQKFIQHQKLPSENWRDFMFEISTYFDEWILGLEVKTFEQLRELLIADQIKKRATTEMKQHFIDEWGEIKSPQELANKLDAYENVRNTTRKVNYQFGNKMSRYEERNNSQQQLKANRGWKPFPYTNVNDRRQVHDSDRRNVFDVRFHNTNRHASSNDFRNNTYNGRRTWNERNDHFYNSSKHNTNVRPKTNYYKHSQNFNREEKREDGNIIRNKQAVVDNVIVRGTDAVDPSTYLKNAKINNSEVVSALIDTGSSSCLLKESIAIKLNLQVTPEEDELFGFGNQTKPAAKTIGKTVADIEIDDVIGNNITLLIVKDCTLPTDLIVGRTWIDLPHIVYARIGKEFYIKYASENPHEILTDINNQRKIKLTATSEIDIEANSINYVKAKTEDLDNGLVMIASSEDNWGSLLEVREGETVVPITNYRNEKLSLKKNQCIGRAEVTDLTEVIKSCQDEDTKNSMQGEVFMVNEVSKIKKLITLEEIKIDSSINQEGKQEILNLVNEYRDCFALNMGELGCTNLTKMDIKELEENKPVCMKPYKTNSEERNAIRKIVDEWKKYGIVTETRSPYASPVLLVKKKTGELRLVVDYRKLNSQTIKDKFPLPRIDDLLECLSECKLFTTLDLAHGYLQIPLTEEAKLKTAFVTPDDTGQFERMIFGLANAPAEFQRLMNQVLGPLLNKEVLCYLDDILIPAISWNEMMDKLRKVFECLRAANLTLKITKCEFGKSEVEYLGFMIKSDGMQPGPRKVRAVLNFPKPTNEHEVRKFLGLTSFFRRFVPKYSEKAEPLTRLTRKNEKFQWNADQQEAFNTLKHHLTNQPVLALYNPEAETEVHTDASSRGLAGMLLQKGSDKKWHMVYCVSKGTTEAERNYHSSKLELMAIVWTLTRLRQFLIGIKFTIVTDCQALVYLNAKKTSNPQIARWSNLIQEYDFEIKHRPGEKMKHVDALSRSPVDQPEETLDSIIENNFEVSLTLTTDEQILMIQHSDPELRKLIDTLRRKASDRTNAEKQMIENYILKHNRLFRKVNYQEKEKLLYVIPKSMRKGIVIKFHDLFGHFSVDRTVAKIKESYWFKGMKRYVRRHISMCFQCLVNKVPSGKKQGVLHPIRPGRRPFAIIHIDHLGPFVKSSKGNKELFVIIDNFTRFTRLYPMKSTSTKTVLIALKNFIDDFGLPERIISDRGTCFTSKEFEEYCSVNGIRHTLNSTQHPQGNGMVERANRTILTTIKTNMENPNHRDWDKKIKECEKYLNNMINKTTDKTPFELLHGYSPKFNDGLMRMITDEDANEWEDPVILQNETRKRIEDKQMKVKASYDKKKGNSLTFEQGEIVVMRRVPKPTGDSTKTQPKYRGPLIITEVLPSDTYRVTQLEEKGKGRFFCTTAHVSQLKSWQCQVESEESGSNDDSDDDDSISKTKRWRKRKKKGW